MEGRRDGEEERCVESIKRGVGEWEEEGGQWEKRAEKKKGKRVAY